MYRVAAVTVARGAIARGEPTVLASLFTTNAGSRASGDRTTRNDRRLRPPVTRTAAGQRAFSYQATALLNQLPAALLDLDPGSFKRAAKAFF